MGVNLYYSDFIRSLENITHGISIGSENGKDKSYDCHFLTALRRKVAKGNLKIRASAFNENLMIFRCSIHPTSNMQHQAHV